MKKLICQKCRKESNSFVHCPLYGAICTEHCQTCTYWTGPSTWNCVYKKAKEDGHRRDAVSIKREMPVVSPTTTRKTETGKRAERVVEKFRHNFQEANKRIAERRKKVK